MNHALLIPRRRSGFSPLNFGSDLALWLDPSYGVYTDRSTQLVAASSQYWSVASNATLQTGDIDFWVAGWVYFDSVAGNSYVASKDNGVNREWIVYRTTTALNLLLYDGANLTGAATSTITLATGGWYFVFAYHDAVNNQVGIRVNAESLVTAATSGPGGTSAADATFGGIFVGGFSDARLDSWMFGKNPVGGIAALTTTIRDYLYNSGAGRVYSDLSAAQATAWGLVYAYDFDGDGLDAHGSNDLTAVNSPTYAAGIASGTAGDGDVVSLVVPRVGSNLTPGGYTTRPLYETAELNGRPIVRFDGTNDYLKSAAFTLDQPWTIAIVAKLRTGTIGGSATWWDGHVGNDGRAYQSVAGYATMYAGSNGPVTMADISGAWKVIAATYNGASSTLRLNADANLTGDTGAANAGGFTLAAFGDGSNVSALDVAEVVIVKKVLSTAEETSLRNYLNSRYAIY